MTAPFRFGILTPMPSELRPVVKAFALQRGRCGDLDGHVGTVGGAEVLATRTGIGIERAAAATRRLLDGADIDHVVVVGVAGGLGPTVGIADVVVPEVVTGWPDRTGYRPAPLGGLEGRGEIVSSDEYGYPPETIAAFIASGVLAVDMETVAVAAECAARDVPWSAVRAISDPADDDSMDPAVLSLATPDGSPDLGASVLYLLRHPGRLPGLLRLAKDATAAANAAARTAARACAEAT